MNILQITTVHPRRDTRIFYRECLSLRKAGHEVTLLVADGKGDEMVEGVQIIDIGIEKTRLKNFIKSFKKISLVAENIKPDVVHFHDPELILVGRRLVRKGIPIVFDIHENVAAQILNKPYIHKFFRKAVSRIYSLIETYCIRHLHLIIAEHSYESVYNQRGKSLTTILNMPEIGHFKDFVNTNRKGNDFFYIGGISEERGLYTTIEALKILKEKGYNFFMHYIGPITDDERNRLNLDGIKNHISFYGRMDSKLGFEISKRCIAGLSVLKPIKNYVESYSTKIFEYMAIGLPVITSNFPLYRDVVEKYECGLCIDPYSSKELADSLEKLISDSQLVKTMGENGIKAVKGKFNWNSEEVRLLELYESFSISK